jgi:hypothetical protein
MRQYRTYAIAQAYAYTAQIAMTAHHVSRLVSCVLGLALGTGVVVLLAQLSVWLSV